MKAIIYFPIVDVVIENILLSFLDENSFIEFSLINKQCRENTLKVKSLPFCVKNLNQLRKYSHLVRVRIPYYSLYINYHVFRHEVYKIYNESTHEEINQELVDGIANTTNIKEVIMRYPRASDFEVDVTEILNQKKIILDTMELKYVHRSRRFFACSKYDKNLLTSEETSKQIGQFLSENIEELNCEDIEKVIVNFENLKVALRYSYYYVQGFRGLSFEAMCTRNLFGYFQAIQVTTSIFLEKNIMIDCERLECMRMDASFKNSVKELVNYLLDEKIVSLKPYNG